MPAGLTAFVVRAAGKRLIICLAEAAIRPINVDLVDYKHP
jgi:hypothetical protein